jgi:hypothetical protein
MRLAADITIGRRRRTRQFSRRAGKFSLRSGKKLRSDGKNTIWCKDLTRIDATV